MEALAKGAVRFSRKFSIRELRDRWYSLLYDPVISVEASARMVEFELSASSKFVRSGIGMHNAESPPKRKVESVRKLYHALRKKTCIRPSNSPNVSLLVSPNRRACIGGGTACQGHQENPVVSSMPGDCVHNHFEFQEMDIDLLHHGSPDNNLVQESVENIFEHKNVHGDSAHILGETLVDFGNCPGVGGMGSSNALPEGETSFHTLGYSSPQPRTPLWKTIEDIPAPAMPINLSHEVEDKGQSSEETFMLPNVMDAKKISLSAISESDLADLSDSLLNLENEDELHPVDPDRKDAINKSCYDGNNQILLHSNNALDDDVPDLKEPNTCLAIPNNSSNAELEVTVDQSLSHNGNQHDICCSELNMPSSALIRNCQSHELLDGEMECVLNSEDPEIPCNDDFMSCKMVEAGELGSSFSTKKSNEQKLNIMRKEDNSAKFSAAALMGGLDLFPESSHNHPHLSCGVKSKSLEDTSQCRSTLTAKKSIAHTGLEQESLHAYSVAELPSSSTTDPAALDQEDSENDEDIACFSDIESLVNAVNFVMRGFVCFLSGFVPLIFYISFQILDMDLCPDDQDSCFSREGNSCGAQFN